MCHCPLHSPHALSSPHTRTRSSFFLSMPLLNSRLSHSHAAHSGRCVSGRCACVTNFVGASCQVNASEYTELLQRAMAAADRLRRRRVDRHHHLCLAAWRQELAEGSPLTFTLCRRQLLPYQAWVRRRVGGRRGRFRIVAGGKAHSHLCVTAYPLHGDEAE